MGFMGDNSGGGAASFLPADYVARKAELRNNIITLSLFAVVMAAVAASFFYKDHQWRRTRDEFVAVNEAYEAEGAKIEQLKQLEQVRGQMMEKAQITSALVEKVPRWAMLGELQLRMPKTMWLEQFTLKSARVDGGSNLPKSSAPAPTVKTLTDIAAGADAKRIAAPSFTYAVTVVGSAERNNDVADFLSSLKQSPIFRTVELTFIRESREGEKTVRKFEITCVLRPDVDSKVLMNSLEKLVANRQQQMASDGGVGKSLSDGTPKGQE